MSYELVLSNAENSGKEIRIIHEVVIYRLKNGLNDFMLGPNSYNAAAPNYFYDTTGGPGNLKYGPKYGVCLREGLGTDVEAIDISSMVMSYGMSFENQFSSSQCNLEIVNINGLFSPENITFLENSSLVKSVPVIYLNPNVMKTGATASSGNMLGGNNYYLYNPNYFMNDKDKFNPLLSPNHIVKVREALVDGDDLDELIWEDKFLGLISSINPGSDGGNQKISITCHDFMKLLNQSSCNRNYISSILDLNGQYFYSQRHNSNLYNVAPSNKIENFTYGLKKDYSLPETIAKLNSEGDFRTWTYKTNAVAQPVTPPTPYWTQLPAPRIYLGGAINPTQAGFMVRYYNGLEPVGDPAAIVFTTEINFTGAEDFIPPSSNIRSANNWCCVIDTELIYPVGSDGDFNAFGVTAEGGVQILFNNVDVGSSDGCRARSQNGFKFKPDINGFPKFERILSPGDSSPNGYFFWVDNAETSKLNRLTITYKCGQSYGNKIDNSNIDIVGWRNILIISSASSSTSSDLANSFSGLEELKWNLKDSNLDNNTTYNFGIFSSYSYNGDYPSFIINGDYGTILFGSVLNNTTATVTPRTYFEILADDSSFGYNTIYTKGAIEFKKPVDLGSSFSLYARYAYKDIINSNVSILRVIQDLIVEDVFGVPRYLWDADDSQYNLDSNNDLFTEFVKYVDINDPKVFLDSIRLDNNSTRNCFDALSKVLGSLYSNFKIRATSRGEFFGDSIIQGGAPVFSITEKISASDTSTFLKDSIPKTNNITDRDFFSLSFIGYNQYQDPDQNSSVFRRESFIFGEIAVDKPGLKSEIEPNYIAPTYDLRKIIIKKFNNLKIDTINNRIKMINDDSQTVFVDRMAMYRRVWAPHPTNNDLPKWVWERYEFNLAANFVKVVSPSTPGGQTLNAYTSEDFDYIYIKISDILTRGSTNTNNTPIAGNNMVRITGYDTANYTQDYVLISPKSDLIEEELEITNPVDDQFPFIGFTLRGAPLIIDYKYRTLLSTSISSPIDESEQYTAVKVTGKRRFRASADILEDRQRRYEATDIIQNINLAGISASSILYGIMSKNTPTLGSGGLTQGFLSDAISDYSLTEYRSSYKIQNVFNYDYDISNVSLYHPWRYPGLLLSYGKTNNDNSITWSSLTEYVGVDGEANFYSGGDAQSVKDYISGSKAARLFTFRYKYLPGFHYEFAMGVDDGGNYGAKSFGDLTVNGVAENASESHPGGVDPLTYSYVRLSAANLLASGEYATIEGRFRSTGDKGHVAFKFKKSPTTDANGNAVNVGSVAWDKILSEPIKAPYVYAGGDPVKTPSAMDLKNVTDPDNTSVTYDIGVLTYGRFKTFLMDNNSAKIPMYGFGNTSFGNIAYYGSVPFLEYNTINIDTLYGLTPKSILNYPIITTGDWYSNGGGVEDLHISGTSSFPDVSLNGTQLQNYPAEVPDGFNAFDINLQKNTDIGEIGLLIGLPPYELNIDDEIVNVKQEFTGSVGFFRTFTRQNSYETTGYVAGGYLLDNYDYGNGSIQDVIGLNLVNSEFASAGVANIECKKSIPKTLQNNPLIYMEISILARKSSDDSSNWKTLVDWQKVNTRAEFYKFNFDNTIDSSYQYLRIKFRKCKPVAYTSEIENQELFLSGNNENLIAGPLIQVENYTGLGLDAVNVRQVMVSNPAVRNMKFFNVQKMYILEKEDVFAYAYSSKDIKSRWYNPMLPSDKNKLTKLMAGSKEIVNDSLFTLTDINSGNNPECLNRAIKTLNEYIRPKESITINIAYAPKLEINQTVWVRMGAAGGYIKGDDFIDENNSKYVLHPGKVMIIDKISHNKSGLAPSVSVTLRNYR